MKKTLLLIFVLSGFLSFAQKIKFKETKHNFGYIEKGEIDTIMYFFTNEGDAPLIIKDSKVECNCTKVKFPKDPVSPGASDTVKVIYDTKGAIGLQDRVVIIISNSKKGDEKLHFKGEVLARKKVGF